MTFLSLSGAPPTARIWIYGAARPLSEAEVTALEGHMARFLGEWRSHGREIEPSWSLVHGQFILIGVDESAMSVSGCSIDSMFRAVEEFSAASGVDFSRSGDHVFYRDRAGAIHRADRVSFRDLAREGAVDAGTMVFDNTIPTLGDFRSGRWEVPMRESWHMKAFGGALSPVGGQSRV